MQHVITRFAENGYLAVFVLMALESACIPIPSEVTMGFAGALASSAAATIAPGAARLTLAAVVAVGVVANLVGSWIAYGVGRRIGRGPLDRWGKYVLIRSHDIDKAEAWWARHGQGAVFFSRMLPVVRTFISLPAGMAEMPFARFSTYTIAGSLPWVTALGAAGYVLGENWTRIIGSFNIASIVIATALVATAALFLLRRRRSRASV